MNFDGNKSTEGSAWEVASDPSASEKHWMAACTLLDGKQHPAVRSSRKLPALVGLPWSIAVSGFAALGATLIFSFIEYSISSVLPGSHINVFDGAHSYALLGGIFITFSSIFVFQKQVWGGGRIWWIPYFGLMGFLACMQSGSGLIPFLNPIVYAGLSLLTVKLTLNSVKALDKSVGAHRVLSHGRNLLVGTGVMCAAMRVLNFPSDVATLTMLAWVPICLLGSGYMITMLNKTANPHTASTIALAAWSPLTLTNLFLFAVVCTYSPAVALGSAQPWLQSFVNSILISMGTLTCLTLGPVIGATTASRMVQRARELELHKTPAQILSELAPEASNTEYLETSSQPTV